MSLLKRLNLPPLPPETAAPEEPRYEVRFGRHDLKAVTLAEALRALTAEYQLLRSNCDVEMRGHGERMQRAGESLGTAAIALISEKLGGAAMPPLEIWDPAFAALDRARQAMRASSVTAAIQALGEAEQARAKARAAVLAYDGNLEKGGERAITGLKATATVGAVAAGVATGGAASAAGLGVLGTAGAGAASAGAYGATQELAGQASEAYIADTRKKIDWAGVLRRGATDAITGFVGGIVGGALTKQFSKLFGSYLGKLTEPELAELGKALGMPGALPRDYFMTAGQKFVAEFLSSAALAPVNAAITQAVNRVSGGAKGPENMQAFMEGVAQDIVQGGAIQLFVAFLTHKMPAGKPGKGSGQPGAEPPPKVVAAEAAPKPAPAASGPTQGGKVGGRETVVPAKPVAKPSEIPAPSRRPGPTAANDNVEHPLGGKRAANDNVETPPPNKPTAAEKPKPALPKAQPANDNVEIAQKMAAGAEGQRVVASAGGKPPGAGAAGGPAGRRPGAVAAAEPPATTSPSAPTSGAGAAGKRAAVPITKDNIKKVPGMQTFLNRLSKRNLRLNDLGLTPEKVIEMANRNPAQAIAELNKRVDIHEVHAAEVEQQPVTRKDKVDAPHAETPAEKKLYRQDAVGKNPGKDSAVGKQVIARMRKAGLIKGAPPNELVFHAPTKTWYPLAECEMGHTVDAVTWWNEKGMFHGEKSEIVRQWMNNPDIYELEPGSINASRGAQLTEGYVAAHPDPITPAELAGQVKDRTAETEE